MLDAFEGHSWLEVVVWEFRKPLEFRQKLMKYSDNTWLCELQNKLGHFCKRFKSFVGDKWYSLMHDENATGKNSWKNCSSALILKIASIWKFVSGNYSKLEQIFHCFDFAFCSKIGFLRLNFNSNGIAIFSKNEKYV